MRNNWAEIRENTPKIRHKFGKTRKDAAKKPCNYATIIELNKTHQNTLSKGCFVLEKRKLKAADSFNERKD